MDKLIAYAEYPSLIHVEGKRCQLDINDQWIENNDYKTEKCVKEKTVGCLIREYKASGGNGLT